MAVRNEQQQIVINANYELFVAGLVVLSMFNNLAMLFPIEQQARDLIGIVDFGIACFLMGDFVYRLLRIKRKRDYLITNYGWLDLIGSLPFIGLRVARLIRLAIMGRRLRRSDLQAMGEVVIARTAQSALLGVVLLVVVVIELGGLSMLKVEANAPNANITTASDALWWGTVTVATVGYGDRYPVTNAGRIVAVFLMTVGLGLFSVLTSFLADWFRRPGERKERWRPLRLIPAPNCRRPRACWRGRSPRTSIRSGRSQICGRSWLTSSRPSRSGSAGDLHNVVCYWIPPQSSMSSLHFLARHRWRRSRAATVGGSCVGAMSGRSVRTTITIIVITGTVMSAVTKPPIWPPMNSPNRMAAAGTAIARPKRYGIRK